MIVNIERKLLILLARWVLRNVEVRGVRPRWEEFALTDALRAVEESGVPVAHVGQGGCRMCQQGLAHKTRDCSDYIAVYK